MIPAGSGLSFEQAPPLSVPWRFFLSAPLFALAAALLLAVEGEALLTSRHAPATLAATHLLTLGFMAMVMLGAMMQMLPVIAGSPIRAPRRIAWLVHGHLVAGTLALALGFLQPAPGVLRLALGLLGAGLTIFIGAAAFSLWRARAAFGTVNGMAFAVAALALTLVLGLLLGAGHAGDWVPPAVDRLRALHPAWGLAGWTGLLVIGVAYQVVPMFQITPAYPAALTRWLAGGLFAALALWSLAPPGWAWTALPPAAALTLFALMTLRLQGQRRRKVADVTLDFWRLGLACLLAATLLWSTRPLLPHAWLGRADLLLGALAICGFALSVINGMLYKIMPFLAWFHLQSRHMGRRRLPHVKELLPDADARRQLRVHAGALALLFAAIAFGGDAPAHAAGLALAASSLLLWINQWNVARRYLRAGKD